MDKKLQILAGVMIFLAILASIFLLTSRKKTQTPALTNKQAATAEKKVLNAEKNQTVLQNQWRKCKSKTMEANSTLFWNVQISEAIPAGGTYAKGTLENDLAFPVHVIIKNGAKYVDKINEALTVGKMANVRGTCTDVASDGSVVFQAF
jgi:TorA maturation chaperone TorD